MAHMLSANIFQFNSLEPDQDQCSVGPDLGLNCFAKAISRQQKPLLAKNELGLKIQFYAFESHFTFQNAQNHIFSENLKKI